MHMSCLCVSVQAWAPGRVPIFPTTHKQAGPGMRTSHRRAFRTGGFEELVQRGLRAVLPSPLTSPCELPPLPHDSFFFSISLEAPLLLAFPLPWLPFLYLSFQTTVSPLASVTSVTQKTEKGILIDYYIERL